MKGDRIFCFLLACFLLYSCFLTVTTINVKEDGETKHYYVTAVQFMEGCFLDYGESMERREQIENKANEISDPEKRELYLSNNLGAEVLSELQEDNKNDEKLNSKMLLFLAAIFSVMFFALLMVVFTFIGMFRKNFSKVNLFLGIISLVFGIFASLASVFWLSTVGKYSISMGYATIFYVFYPAMMIVFSAKNAKE